MATVPTASKASTTALALPSILLAVSGDTLQFLKNKSQELWLFNTSGSTQAVTVDGNAGTVVVVPGTAGSIVDVSSGLTINIPANGFAFTYLDKAEAFLQGTVSITASTGAVVRATVVTP